MSTTATLPAVTLTESAAKHIAEIIGEPNPEGKGLRIEDRGLVYLAGSVIDYKDGLSGAGFRITNPNAKQTCGCGKSFEA